VNRTGQAVLVSAGLIALLVIVALAAQGGHPGGEGRVSPRPVPVTLQDSFVNLLAIAYLLAVIAVIVLFFHRRPIGAPRESRWLRNFVMVMALALVVTLFGSWAIRHGHFRPHDAHTRIGLKGGQATDSRKQDRLPNSQVRHAKFEWPLAAGVAGLLVLGGIVFWVRRRRHPDAPEATLQEELLHTIDTTIGDLRHEGDARRAVIASYANMERILGSHGLARSPAEAPLEYLGRVLDELDVRPNAVRSLTSLYEYAKFSRHEIDGEMKEAAIAALLVVRDDLSAEAMVAA
jgi:Domain of unknown function (DUF4129)